MPILFSTREGETAGIVFPLTQNNQPFQGGSIERIELVLSGFNGQLRGTVVNNQSRLYFVDAANGLVVYFPDLGELHHNFSPYKLYFRLFSDEIHYETVPAPPQYYLLTVEDNNL